MIPCTSSGLPLDHGSWSRYTPSTPETSLHATDSSFTGNSAAGLAGGLHTTASNVTLTNCHVDGNSAGTGAGGVYVDSLVTFLMESSSFVNNSGKVIMPMSLGMYHAAVVFS